MTARSSEREQAAATRAEQLRVAKRNVELCRADLAKPEASFPSRATAQRLLEHWQGWVARLSTEAQP